MQNVIGHGKAVAADARESDGDDAHDKTGQRQPEINRPVESAKPLFTQAQQFQEHGAYRAAHHAQQHKPRQLRERGGGKRGNFIPRLNAEKTARHHRRDDR